MHDAFTFTWRRHRTLSKPHTTYDFAISYTQTPLKQSWKKEKRNYINYSSDEPNYCNALYFAFFFSLLRFFQCVALVFLCISCINAHTHSFDGYTAPYAATYGYWNTHLFHRLLRLFVFLIFFVRSFVNSFEEKKDVTLHCIL